MLVLRVLVEQSVVLLLLTRIELCLKHCRLSLDALFFLFEDPLLALLDPIQSVFSANKMRRLGVNIITFDDLLSLRGRALARLRFQVHLVRAR